MSNISIIVAMASNNGIGYNNQLLYWLPNDLKRFKTLTTGHTIIMGRKTFESLPKGALPNRRNIVLTKNTQIQFPGAETFLSLEDALKHCCEDEEIFIIGGESVYRQAINIANKIYLTLINDSSKETDAHFPTIDPTIWKEKSREVHQTDEKHLYPYTFINYVKD